MPNGSINYDNLSYPNYVFADTHPARIAACGKFFGLPCTDSSKSRVLEIGCAGGLNILSHALSLPEAEFVAVDYSSQQIKAALELQKLARINNVRFACQKLESIGDSFGKFDYIICHGVFSWVSRATQHEILLLCSHLLNDAGIAFISYNTLPGWHIQQIIRDALLYRGKDAKNEQELGKISKDFLRFSKDLFPKNAQSILKPTIDHLLEVPDNYLAHEHLADINSPLYFHQFTELCQEHGLIYLAESDIGSMIPREFPPDIQDQLVELAGSSLSKIEQYCDFLRLRQFRKTLICKQTCKPQRQIDYNRLMPLHAAASKSHLSNQYRSKEQLKGSKLEILDREFPSSYPVKDLVAGNDSFQMLSLLLEHVMLENIELRDTPADGVKGSNISPLAKALLPFGNVVPNYRSDSVVLRDALHQKLKNVPTPETGDISELAALGLLFV